MLKIFLVALAGMMLLTGQRASAEESVPNCVHDFDECMVRARALVNDIEVSVAQKGCYQEMGLCNREADHIQQQQEQEQLEKPADKPQENDTINGNINTYRFDK